MTSKRLLRASLMLSMIGGGLYASFPLYNEPPGFDFHAYAGYRMDQLEFSIAERRQRRHGWSFKKDFLQSSDDHSSEEHHHHRRGSYAQVKWKSLKIAQIGAILNLSTYNHYCFKASADYGRICDGRANIDTRFHFKTLAPPEPPKKHHKHHSARKSRYERHLRDLGLDFEDYKSSLYGITVHRGMGGKKRKDERSKEKSVLVDTPEKAHIDALLLGESVAERRSHRRRHRKRHRTHHHAAHHQHEPRYNHHIEESRQVADADDGNVADLSAGIGYKFISDTGRTWVTGLLGWSGHAQQLRLSNVVQEKDTHNLAYPGSTCFISGKYDVHWQGPWVGFDFLHLVDYNVTIYGSGEWHWASYEARGNWNYGNVYNAGIRHRARGYGVVGTLGLDWNFCTNWNVGIIGNFQQWSTRIGHNHARIRNRGLPSSNMELIFPVMEKSALSLAKWISFSVSAQIAYRF